MQAEGSAGAGLKAACRMMLPVIAAVVALGGCSRTAPEPQERITAPPPGLETHGYYAKYLDAGGIPILAAASVDDLALVRLKAIINEMLAKRPDVRGVLQAREIRFAIIPRNSFTTDLPELRDLYKLFPGRDWNRVTRGGGATEFIPVVSCAEENLLKLPSDVYLGESICVHEFAHTMHEMGLRRLDPGFDDRLNELYRAALDSGVIASTYAATAVIEYFAEMSQSFLDTNLCREVTDGYHGPVCRNAVLKQRDPEMWKLLDSIYNLPPAKRRW